MIDQKNQLKQVAQRQKCSKTAVKVGKVTAFGENILPGQCQPYVGNVSKQGRDVPQLRTFNTTGSNRVSTSNRFSLIVLVFQYFIEHSIQ